MFTDSRSKKVVLVAHCILNQNSISDGTADYLGTFRDVVNLLLESDVGMIQMPCPELLCLGLDRGNPEGVKNEVVVENTRIRKSLKEESSSEKMNFLVDQVISQIEEYKKFDFSVLGVIGVNRSPSCGVETTSMDNNEISGKGLFIDTLKDRLDEKDIHVEMVGIKTSEIDKSLEKVRGLLEND